MPWMPYKLIWAHLSCYSCRFMYYIPMQLIYILTCLVEIKLFQIVSNYFIFEVIYHFLKSLHFAPKYSMCAHVCLNYQCNFTKKCLKYNLNS